MNCRLMPHGVLLVSVFGLSACGDDTTQPNLPGEQLRAPEFAVASNSWIRRADMWSVERQNLTVATVTNAAGQSVVYAIGGRSTTGSPLGKVMAYNVVTNTWTLKASLPIPLKSPNQAAVLNGKIYVSGGCQYNSCDFAYDGASDRLYVYDPAADTWTRKQDMPGVRNSSGVLLFSGTSGVSGVIGGKLYTLSDCYYGDAPRFYRCDPSLFFRYNATTDQWTVLPSPSFTYKAGGVIGGKFYVAGTSRDPYTGQATLRTEVYDPATNRWSRRAPPPVAVDPGSAASAVLKGQLYLIGGRVAHPPDGPIDTIRTVTAYDPTTNTWTTKAPLPSTRLGFAATKVFLNGQPRIEVVGGYRPGNNLQYVP